MQNKKLIRFAQALAVLPTIATSGPVAPVPQAPAPAVVAAPIASTQKFNIETSVALALNQVRGPKVDDEKIAREAEEKVLKAKGDAIDTYFKSKGMPLEGTGYKMASEAEKNGLDWRLIAAISVRESTGGKQECTRVPNNPFGWGSCKIGFKSNDAAIETVALNLGGNNPKTARHYDNKSTTEILRAYNPPSVVPKYAEQVISIMNTIGDADIILETANS